jgi:dihydrodipicolinate synthase/N-acetylneuraminate lyase
MVSSRREKLQGILVSLPTFNDEKFNLRLDRSKTHIRWLIDQGIVEGSGVLMIAGGLGEGYFLDDDEWQGMAHAVVEAADGKVPTMIGLFELSARRATKKARYVGDPDDRPGIDTAVDDEQLRVAITFADGGQTEVGIARTP